VEALDKNGTLVLTGISGESHTAEVPDDRILLGFVLCNKISDITPVEHAGTMESFIRAPVMVADGPLLPVES
jgi:hypothetical protein